MIEVQIRGKHNTAIVFSEHIDEESHRQIQELCDQPVFAGIKIRIMPDVHAGKGCVIGYTASLSGKLIPNLIGLDIGCGILSANLGRMDLSCDKLDHFIRRNIPHGFERNKSVQTDRLPERFVRDLDRVCKRLDIKVSDHAKGIGSLGGGNHFIEIAADSEKNKWLLIHSGSRNFGLQVATWHQARAQSGCREKGIKIPRDFAFLEGPEREDYLEDMKTAQEYASLNREEMMHRILRFLKIDRPADHFETVHNYINFKDGIIRKGAISAHQDERMLIPLNMRDGSIIATGKGNPRWNWSAPHGAGRRMSRRQAKKNIDMEEFRKSMKRVWSSSVSEKTIDEAPMAYKPQHEILKQLEDTATISDRLTPLYNFKSG